MRMLMTLAIAAMLLVPGTAFAQDDPLEALSDADFDRVVELLERAREAEEAEQWRVALGFFEEVSAIVTLPEVRVREARANVALGEVPEAADIYAELVAGDGPVAEEAAEALLVLQAEYPPTLRLGIAGAEARVSIDGGEPDTYSVGEHDIALSPGAHTIEVRAVDNAPVTLEVDVGVGEVQERYVTFVAPPLEVAAAPTPEPEATEGGGGNGRIALPATLTVLTVGAFAGGAVLGLDSNAKADDYRSARSTALTNANQIAPNDAVLGELQGLRDDSFARATQANILYGVGSALAVGSAVTWWWALKDRGDRDADVALLPALGGGSVRVQW